MLIKKFTISSLIAIFFALFYFNISYAEEGTVALPLPTSTLEPIKPISVSYLNYDTKQHIFQDVKIKIGEKSLVFPWQSRTWKEDVRLKTFSDANKNFLLIRLIHNVGTGIHMEDIHVINIDTMQEIPVEHDNNLTYLQNNFHSLITNNPPTINMKTAIQTIKLSNSPYLNKIISSYPNYNEFVFFNDIDYEYGISPQNRLTCAYRLMITPLYTIGSVIIPYYYDTPNNIFRPNNNIAPFIQINQIYF